MATYNDYPQSATNNAKKVLAWKKKYGSEVKGMTSVGWTRANQLASRRKLSYDTIARMAAFNRHRKNAAVDPKYKNEPWKDRGYVAWLGWGGTSGINWAIRKAESIRKGTVKASVDVADVPWGDRKVKDDYATQGKDGSVKKSPKAPKSDTPEKNPKGVGKGGKLSPKIIKSIESKIAKHNEKDPDKKVGVGAAKRVVLRGMGPVAMGMPEVLLATALEAWDGNTATLRNLYTGDTETREFDSLVLATTNTSDHALFDALQDKGIELHTIGDTVASRTAHMAFYEARKLALTL